jgi:hypothetical protein
MIFVDKDVFILSIKYENIHPKKIFYKNNYPENIISYLAYSRP